MNTDTPDHIADVESYVDAVLTGDKPACQWERLACQRHRDDMAREPGAEWPYEFDEARALKVIRFIELLPHVKGHWVAQRGPAARITLEPWQKFILASIFGWVHCDTRLRRYRLAHVAVPRKNGKSVLAAGIGLYMLSADGEHGAEVYCGATSEKQAWEVFGPASKMAKRTVSYLRAYGVEVNARSLQRQDGSKFEPVIGNPGDGSSPSCAIVDEYHEHKNEALFDTMVTGMGARQQPLALVITTAGSDIAGPCYALQRDLEKVLTGAMGNNEMFGVVYGIDPDDDWTSPAALIKANPNYGVSVGPDFLQAEQRYAVQSARKQATFKTKHLNVWVSARAAWMNMEWWRRQADNTLRREDFADEAAYKGLDLSAKYDITADVTCYRRVIDGVDHYYLFGRFYVPEDVASDDEHKHYAGWVHDGRLIATDGDIIDYQRIQDDIVSDAKVGNLQDVGFDPWGATQFAQTLQEAHGIDCVEVPQNVKNLSEPMKQFEALVKTGRLHHDGNPCFDWMVANVTAKEDANENIYPRKESPEKKIDGAVAGIMALSRAMAGQQNAGIIVGTGATAL